MATDDHRLIKSTIMFNMADFFLTVPHNAAINYYFDSAMRNSTLSVHYQIMGRGGFAETWGECVNLLCNLNIFMIATCSI